MPPFQGFIIITLPPPCDKFIFKVVLLSTVIAVPDGARGALASSPYSVWIQAKTTNTAQGATSYPLVLNPRQENFPKRDEEALKKYYRRLAEDE